MKQAKIENVVQIYTPAVPAKGQNGGQYRRSCDICIVECPADKNPIRRTKHTIVLHCWSDCDRRYTGRKSRYGQCFAAAEETLGEILSGDLTRVIRLKQLRSSANHLFGLSPDSDIPILADSYDDAGMQLEADELRTYET